MFSMVDQMIEAEERRSTAKTDSDVSYYSLRCVDIDKRIDALVAKIYGLSEADLDPVEKALEFDQPEKKGVKSAIA